MWNTAVTADTDLPRAAVWAALEALHRGELSYPGADVFELHGPFAVGTELDVTPGGQDTFRSVIIELVPGERYADRTEYEGLSLLFRHTLVDAPTGTRVTHELEIDGAGADEVGPELGPQISGDFGAALEALFREAARMTA